MTLQRLPLTVLALLISYFTFGQRPQPDSVHKPTAPIEKHYNENNPNLPDWVKMMYADRPDIGRVTQAKNEYYRTHPFVKSEHTQYYKRWLRDIEKHGDPNHMTDAELKAKEANDADYLERSKKKARLRSANASWSGLGPIDFDKDGAGRSYAAGAAHVYTTEQSVSNPNTLYAGSAEAGLWKSTDKGATWLALTRDLLINTVYSLEIDFTDANIVYFSGAGKLWKTTNGGTTITQIGDTAFRAVAQDIKDIVMDPTNHNILLLASDQGLYRTTDGGANWTLLMNQEFQEIEFQPTHPNVVYAVRLVGSHTEFYKSTDGGISYTAKAGGYPGITSASSRIFSSVKMNGTGDYVTFANNDNPGTAAMPDFTIEMLVRGYGWTGDPAIFSNKNWANGANDGFAITGRTNGNGWQFNIGNGTQRIDMTGNNISDGALHHIAIVYRSSGNKELYQDGVLLTSTTTHITALTANALTMALGQDGTLGYASAWKGEVAELRMWNMALPAGVINNYAFSNIIAAHPNFTSLIHYWKMNQTTGTTVADSTGSNTGTLHGGASWHYGNMIHKVTTSITGSDEQKRTEISVTPADPNIVYAFATGVANGGRGLYGIYKSTDAGETWTFKCCGAGPGGLPTPTNLNLCGWDDQGLDDGGQYYYDLSLAASPTFADSIYICGVNLWESYNGGDSVKCPSKWSDSYKNNYVHADIHDIKIYGRDMWLSCDGGIFYSNDNGRNWNRKMLGIAGTDFWGFGQGFQDGSVMIGGAYHNGTLLRDGNTYTNGWLSTDGGDGTRGFVNPGKSRVAYSDYNRKILSGDRTVSPATFNFDKKPNTDGNMEFDPRCYNMIYSPVDSQVWKTTDDGASWQMMYNFGMGNTVEAFKVGWNDPNVMYTTTSKGLYNAKTLWRSDDAGQSWNDITPGSSVIGNNSTMNYKIAVSSDDAYTMWIALTHPYNWYTADGRKVFKSTDGGQSWTNITTATLNGEYIEDMAYVRGSDGGIYLGTARTVYYRNNTLSDWQLFNNQLPLLSYCTRVIPYYKGGKIRNATNRSVYEADLYENTPPSAQISANELVTDCNRDTIFFVNHSACRSGATFQWSFPGGRPATSTAEAPAVTYALAGSYAVSLTVTDANGTSSQSIPNFITITASCAPDTVPGSALQLSGGGDYGSIPAPGISSNSLTFSAWIKPQGNQDDYAGILFSESGGATGLDFTNGNRLGYHWEGDPVSYNWQGGPVPTMDEWHHVAVVITPDSGTIYLDGVPYTRVGGHNAITWDRSILIGSDRNYGNRYYRGLIDEIAIYNRPLSADEVRELMNLTRNNPNAGSLPHTDASLLAYYQFNEANGRPVYDRAGLNHASITGNTATRIPCTAPVGGGTMQRLHVSGNGVRDFPRPGVELTFASGGVVPDGDLVVTRLNVPSDQLCAAAIIPLAPQSYYIFRDYNSNNSLGAVVGIKFKNVQGTDWSIATQPSQLTLYRRAMNADSLTWGTQIATATAATDNSGIGTVTFSTGLNLTRFGQFEIGNANHTLSIHDATGISAQPNATIYPNPSTSGWLNVNFTDISTTNRNASVSVTDEAGRLISTVYIDQLRNSTYRMLIPASGIYMMTIAFEEGRNITKKVVVVK